MAAELVLGSVGLVGLAGLFSSCLEAIDRVKDYKSFSSDSSSLNVQLDAHRVRLERWGRDVGLDNGRLSADHDRRLDDNQTRSVVEELLAIINGTLGSDGRPGQTGSGHTHLDATLGNTKQPRTLEGVGSRRRKLTWALGGKGDRTVQVTQLGKLVQLLHDLVPPDRAASTRPTTDHGWLTEFHQTLAEFRQTLAEAQEPAETRREVHAWLLGKQPPNKRYEDSRVKRLPGTCDWIFTRPAFARWSAADPSPGSARLLWIHGPPGFGKTVLCTRTVEHLSAVPGNTVAHFFFSSDHESRHDPYAAARSWVSQLASQPEAYALVRQRWETTKDHVATRATVIQLLHDVLQATPGCYLVVDSLDECTAPDDGTSSVARFLEDVLNTITSATRLLIVSREETDIRQPLRAGGPARLAEYQISPQDVSADAAAYARDIADRKLPGKDENVRASLSSAMADRCKGQFLWLKMQEPTLKTWKNLGQLQRTLDGTPTGLDRIYERNWEKITRSDQRERAVALLRWSAFALRPLTIDEMTEAVLIDEDLEELPVNELPDAVDDDYIHGEILEVCGPLLEVRRSPPDSAAGKQTLHLAHFTIRQFLIGRLPVGGIPANETLRVSNEQMQNTLLARSCLWYVQSRQTWRDGANADGSPFRAALRDYSAASWHAHVKAGLSLDSDPCTLERVQTFMNEAHPCWKPWRTWFDEHDDEENKSAKDEKFRPGPPYYALKLDLGPVAVSHIRKFGPGLLAACGRSVLNLCCLQGNIEVAEAILDAGGADITVANNDSITPVVSATVNGHLEVVKLLVDKGADITVANKDG
ncbi:hypothetical protein SODALDRAFT_279597 [Sodiomyces alkalinus F11]|uniref:Uncharacterized protein n=1 Tax=Sodiomyces alkalinus (strain CBS 110278 / VKM F-3762 / F11) TaxID=1314773 RepID=A0A3N2PRI8_SODAK|nr:hypothetical protein SODALDRAFT_279597 [Sodiomyces alkalinus F11]ROT37132.1 hypothetical protein SODALDRAFT_279597 [Sodiomyces alkalinus F11]